MLKSLVCHNTYTVYNYDAHIMYAYVLMLLCEWSNDNSATATCRILLLGKATLHHNNTIIM